MLNFTAIAELRARIVGTVEEEAAAILAVSNARIPVDTATAQKSGRVVTDAATGTVWVTYGRDDDQNPKGGGPSNSYIEVLHEDLAAHHPNGSAKFLQSAGDDASRGMGERIAGKARM